MKLKLLEKLGFSISYINTVFNWWQPNCTWDGPKSRTTWFVIKPHSGWRHQAWRSWNVLSSETPAPLESCPDGQQQNRDVGSSSGKEEILGNAAVGVPRMARQAAPLRFSHRSACVNVFLNERGRRCNDNQGDRTKLVWKCMTDFLPSLPFCCATHLTFWSADEVELSPPLHYISPTSIAAMPTGARLCHSQ